MSAATIVEKFGGPAALAKLIGKGQSTVAYWQKIGTVPAKWQPVLLELAQKNGLDLSASDFMPLNLPNLKPAEPAVSSGTPKATHWGDLTIGDAQLPAYVLENGMRVFSLKGVVVGLMGTEGGQLAEYIKVRALRDFLPDDLKPAEDGSIPALFKFDTGGKGDFRYAIGFPVERFIDLCAAYSMALQEHLNPASRFKLTARQLDIAKKAIAFDRACAKVGIIALVDEANSYQTTGTSSAQIKMKLLKKKEKGEKTSLTS